VLVGIFCLIFTEFLIVQQDLLRVQRSNNDVEVWEPDYFFLLMRNHYGFNIHGRISAAPFLFLFKY